MTVPTLVLYMVEVRWMCSVVAQFRLRMGKVVAYMHCEDFQAKDGTGLSGLCRSLQDRCERVLSEGGNRLSH